MHVILKQEQGHWASDLNTSKLEDLRKGEFLCLKSVMWWRPTLKISQEKDLSMLSLHHFNECNSSVQGLECPWHHLFQLMAGKYASYIKWETLGKPFQITRGQKKNIVNTIKDSINHPWYTHIPQNNLLYMCIVCHVFSL